MIDTTRTFIQKHLMAINILFCFLLPPLGVLMLLVMGGYTLHQALKNGQRIHLSPSIFLLGCMLISSLGAWIVFQDHSFFLVTGLILAYIGLYIKISKQSILRNLQIFKWTTIYGCLYFYFLYPFQSELIHPTVGHYIAGTALMGIGDLQNYPRLIGSAYNPNFSVTILLFGLSFLLAEILKNLKKAAYWRVSIQIVFIFAISHAITLTGSRAGFATMVIIYILFCFRCNKIFTLITTALMVLNYKSLLSWLPRHDNLFESAQTRKEIWSRSIDLWEKYPLFGMTPLGFEKEYLNLFQEEIPHAHNLFLAMFTEYGALGGIALLIVVIINMYKATFLFMTKQVHHDLDTFLLSLPVILFTGIFDYVVFSPQVAVLAIMLMAYWDKYTTKLPLLELRQIQLPFERFRYYL